ncbi:MAG: SpoIIE family protein phosphatase [Bernardetiaceae bacterium]|nr:SpoIIE family protein phosphatase [Bernardetiaceae bacterium]
MPIRFFIFLGFWLSFLWFNTAAQAQSVKLRLESLSIENGLSQNTTAALAQDKKGFLWIGTQDGLNRYNGYEIEVFRHKRGQPQSLNGNYINTIMEASDGNIWIGTNVGLNQFSPSTHHFHRIDIPEKGMEGKREQEINHICEDSTQNIWVVGRLGISYYHYPSGKWTHIESEALYKDDNKVFMLFCDAQNNIWALSAKGVFRYEQKTQKFTPFVPKSFQEEEFYVVDMKYDKTKRLLLAYEQTILVYNSENDDVETYLDSPVEIRSFTVDTDYFWISTGEQVLSINRKTLLAQTIPLPPNTGLINDIIKDASGLLWIGTSNMGVLQYDNLRNRFDHYYHDAQNSNSLSNPLVWTITEDAKENLWVGTEEGLNFISKENGKIKRYYKRDLPPLTDDNITYLLMDSRQQLWIATLDGGLYRSTHCDTQGNLKIEKVSRDILSQDRLILSIFEDSQKNIWIASSGEGLIRLSVDKVSGRIKEKKVFAHDPKNKKSIPSMSIMYVGEDKYRNIWTCTDAGLSRLLNDRDGFINYQHNPNDTSSISSNNVMMFWEDKKGIFWLGTENGINRFDPKIGKARHFGEYIEQANYSVYGILGDDKNALWCSTNNGLLHFENNNMRVYTQRSGLQSNEFNSGAFYKSPKSGRLYFGGINGFNAFYPTKIEISTFKPPIVLTQFLIHNEVVGIRDSLNPESPLLQHISVSEKINLEYTQNTIAFEFAALSFRLADKNRYAYKMDGLEDDWNYADTRRFASYNQIPPGKYTFRVKACNHDGVWNEQGIALEIEVHPPFWSTIWFKVFIFFLAIILIFIAYRTRIQSVRLQNQKLERLVAERTGELQDKNKELENAYNNINILSEAGRKITTHIDLELVIRSVYDNVNKLMDAEGFGIGLYNPETETLDFMGYIEKGKTLPTHSMPLNNTKRIAVRSFLVDKEVIVADIEKEYEKLFNEKPNVLIGEVPQSLIYMPLHSKDQKLGVITVQSFRKNAYTDYQVNMLSNLSIYITTAIENAQSYRRIEAQKTEIETQKAQLEKRSSDLTDSIRYASRLQSALLPPEALVRKALPESFILFKPRDIVSGDFYAFFEKEDKIFLAAIDCTGHGVPGAFMSVMAEAKLNQIINTDNIESPDLILAELHRRIQGSLNQETNQNQDGLDMTICVIHKKSRLVQFAGAKNPLVFVQDDRLYHIKGSKFAIGGYNRKGEKPTFKSHQIVASERDAAFYMFSDGYQDQFGGTKNKKFMKKRFREMLFKIHHKPMKDQHLFISQVLDKWMEGQVQIDDILVIGFRV